MLQLLGEVREGVLRPVGRELPARLCAEDALQKLLVARDVRVVRRPLRRRPAARWSGPRRGRWPETMTATSPRSRPAAGGFRARTSARSPGGADPRRPHRSPRQRAQRGRSRGRRRSGRAASTGIPRAARAARTAAPPLPSARRTAVPTTANHRKRTLARSKRDQRREQGDRPDVDRVLRVVEVGVGLEESDRSLGLPSSNPDRAAGC